MDVIGLSGIVVGIVALVVAIYGVRDVRNQVRSLVELERNRLWAKTLYNYVWKLVDPTDENFRAQTVRDIHEFEILERTLDPKQPLDAAQNRIDGEAVALAKELVSYGMASWRQDIDENRALQFLEKWQNERNAKVLQNILGDSYTRLFGSRKER